MNVLSANATKRDAKQYLAQFDRPGDGVSGVSSLIQQHNDHDRRVQSQLDSLGVNLGGLYAPAKAIAESPQFLRKDVDVDGVAEYQHQIHVALVCLRDPQSLSDEVLDGVAMTLSQLVTLDMRILLVLDCVRQSFSRTALHQAANVQQVAEICAQQGARLSETLARHSAAGAQIVSGAIETADPNLAEAALGPEENTTVALPSLLLKPLARSTIPIVSTLAYTSSGKKIFRSTSSVMSSLTMMLSGAQTLAKRVESSKGRVQTSLDRIILLDSAGGVPSKARGGAAHVFVNLEQELPEITAELAEDICEDTNRRTSQNFTNVQHVDNLQMLQKCLAVLPAASSGLIVTPEEAATSSRSSETSNGTIGIGTRRHKNTLIHNLLTNKPTVSASLPIARLPHTSTSNSHPEIIDMPTATLVKRGMPLTIIPTAERETGWQIPPTGQTSLSLDCDPEIDFPRLLHLIENSFRRKLDVHHYLGRVQNRIAGLIVAGSYEGAAILTWEQPPSAPSNDFSRLVPYLDKFAVLSSSQGSSGVADILFQAMVQTCFPRGVCWRSRQDNPVNKWYFERAAGHWSIPGTNWTMFWTGEWVVEEKQRWDDYVEVCRSVGPSWADGKKPD